MDRSYCDKIVEAISVYTRVAAHKCIPSRGREGQKRHKTGGKAPAMHKRRTVFPTRFIQLCCFGNKGYRGLLLKVFPNSTGRLSSRVHHVPQISCWNMTTLTFDLNDVAIGIGTLPVAIGCYEKDTVPRPPPNLLPVI